MAAMPILEGDKVQTLARTVEESTRSTREGMRFFIAPAPGTLARAKNKRHHIVFGRRGSGKSSLLAKVTEDLTIDRSPIAYVDLEEFKSHSYPDVLLSVLIKGRRQRAAQRTAHLSRTENILATSVDRRNAQCLRLRAAGRRGPDRLRQPTALLRAHWA